MQRVALAFVLAGTSAARPRLAAAVPRLAPARAFHAAAARRRADTPNAAAPPVPEQQQQQQQQQQPDAQQQQQQQQQLQQLQERVKDLEDKYVRALAEMENVRARGRRDVDNAKQFGIQGFAKDLLSVADVLRLAIDNAPAEVPEGRADIQQLIVGVQMTEKELLKVFEKHGLRVVDPMGKPFDPNLHNAIFEMDDASKPPGTVAFVQKKGYMLHERSLRAADVGVVRQRG